MHKKIEPIQIESGMHDDETYEHPAFGSVEMSIVTGGDAILAGSDLRHNQRISIKIFESDLVFSYGVKRVRQKGAPLLELEMSHSQFSRFITTPNRSGVPCTIRAKREGEYVSMPGIERIETSNDEHRRNIKRSVEEGIGNITKDIEKLKAELAGGSLSKKSISAILFGLECQVNNLPSNLTFAVSQAERALENATDDAKAEIECHIDHLAAVTGLRMLSSGETLIAIEDNGDKIST